MNHADNNKSWKALITLTLTPEAPGQNKWSWPAECREVKWVTNSGQQQFVTLWVDVKGPEELNTFIGKKIKPLSWVSAVHTAWQQDDWAA